jgi:hypothetical protein
MTRVYQTISPSEKRVLRFGVGSDDWPSSFVWRLWTSGNNTYLSYGPRPDPKFSMHGNVWKSDFGNHRYMFDPIPCVASGWIQGPVVMFCHVPYKPTPAPKAVVEHVSERTNVRWFPIPPVWHLAEFGVFFAPPEILGESFPPPDADDFEHFALGPLPLRDGSKVWVRHLVKPIPTDRHNYLLGVRSAINGFTSNQDLLDDDVLGTVMHLSGSTIVAVPFGAETIREWQRPRDPTNG